MPGIRWSELSALAFAVLILASACTAQLGPRPALPTAVPGVSVEQDDGTPTRQAPRTRASSEPTSTPAPWATPLPPTPPPTPPGIPHDIRGADDCLMCHGSKRIGVPPDHSKRTSAMCRGCHTLSPSAPQPTLAPIPHGIEGRAKCLFCHLQGTNGARPMPGNHAGRFNETCQKCHKS